MSKRAKPKATSKVIPAKKPKLHKRVHARVKRHYYRVMPDKKRHRIFIWVAFFVVAGIIAVQLLYPPERALPLAYVDGVYVGMRDEVTLAANYEEAFQESIVILSTENGEPKEYSLSSTGATIDTDSISRKASDYPFWQRYIPLSVLFPRQVESKHSIVFNEPTLVTFADSAAKDLSVEPKNARLAIENGQLIAEKEAVGAIVDPQAIKQQLTSLSGEKLGAWKMTIPAKEISATTTAVTLSDVRSQTEAALGHPLKLTTSSATITVDSTEVASWLLLDTNEQGSVVLRLDEDKVRAYLQTLNAPYGTAAGTTHVTVVNGRETARQLGVAGSAVDANQLITAIRGQLIEDAPRTLIPLTLTPVAPQVMYNNSYTASQEGLQAYISSVASAYNARIAVRQLGGNGWSAFARADESIPSASTYKLYISWMLFNKMNDGEVGWNDPILDTTVSTCFDRMTIASTNPCAEEWIRQFGRTNINNYLYSQGYSTGTTFTSNVATQTTARDLAKFMVDLENGTNISGTHRDRLLRSLSSHPYRQGVPSGSSAFVYDKVGFLWDYVHDAAIVRHPQGTYVIAVMTKGQSYARIAAITKEVERILYP